VPQKTYATTGCGRSPFLIGEFGSLVQGRNGEWNEELMEREVFVYIELGGSPVLVGRLWPRVRGRKESATFAYDTEWLARPDKFSLQPALMLSSGAFHTGGDRPMFGAIGDSAPDRWGRALMRRAERRRANEAKETPRTLSEVDYLLMVNDFTRQGALRFSLEPGGPFLSAGEATRIPPLVELPKLLSAADSIADESETPEELRLLLAPGSSLGGARPKASVFDGDGRLLIAKFPHKDDEVAAQFELSAKRSAFLSQDSIEWPPPLNTRI